MSMALPTAGAFGRGVDPNERPLRDVADAVRTLSYGEVVIVVQGGNIVAVNKTEKRNYRAPQEK